MKITFRDKTIELEGYKVDSDLFYSLTDIYYRLEKLPLKKQPTEWRTDLTRKYVREEKLLTLNKRTLKTYPLSEFAFNKYKGTFYGTEEVVVSYLDWVSPFFSEKIGKSLSQLLNNNAEEAKQTLNEIIEMEAL